jgi:transcriptional regulator with XRE-family HTH domain
MLVGQVIKELRKEKGWSQEQLATAANLSQTSLSKIENGKRPGIKTLNDLCKALGVPEAVVNLMVLDRSDVPETNRELYDKLFPIIKKMVLSLLQEPA